MLLKIGSVLLELGKLLSESVELVLLLLLDVEVLLGLLSFLG